VKRTIGSREALVVLVLALAVVASRGCGSTTADAPVGVGTTGAASVATASAPSRTATPSVAAHLRVLPAVVSRNVDGDTIHVRLADGTVEKVRFIGVNTPESTIKHQPYGKEASNYTKSRLPIGTAVWLETDVQLRDRYGRVLAYVWLTEPSGGGTAAVRAHMFNAELLLKGYADLMTIPPDVKYVDIFRPMVAEARNADLGLWGLPAK